MLKERLGASEAESALWVILGGGMTVYREGRTPRTESDDAEQYYKRCALPGLRTFTEQGENFPINPFMHPGDAARLMLALLDVEDIEQYDPERWFGRFLSFDQLVKRWRSSSMSDADIEKTIVALNDEAREREIRSFAAPNGLDKWRCPPGTLFALDPFARQAHFWPGDVRRGYSRNIKSRMPSVVTVLDLPDPPSFRPDNWSYCFEKLSGAINRQMPGIVRRRFAFAHLGHLSPRGQLTDSGIN